MDQLAITRLGGSGTRQEERFLAPPATLHSVVIQSGFQLLQAGPYGCRRRYPFEAFVQIF
jgi:hypothetical protein